jgi:hypothetical protein
MRRVRTKTWRVKRRASQFGPEAGHVKVANGEDALREKPVRSRPDCGGTFSVQIVDRLIALNASPAEDDLEEAF